MLSPELFVWLWIAKIGFIINDGIKMATLWAETLAGIKRPGFTGFSRATEICGSQGSVLFTTKSFLAGYFFYSFLNCFRTSLWGTHLKYLVLMRFCVKLHNPVEFSSYLLFLLSNKKWQKLMLISAHMNPENMQHGQVCWKLQLCFIVLRSWM